MNLLLAIMLVLPAPGPLDAAGKSPRSGEQARADTARRHYRDNQYAAAAAAYEALWRDFKIPKYLYNAGLAREGLGHDVHAIVHWRRFLAHPDVGPEEGKKARTKLRAAILRTTLVSLRLGPAEGLADALLRIQREDGEQEPLALSLREMLDGKAGDKSLQLEPGRWTISLEPGTGSAGAYKGAQHTLVIAKGQTEASLELNLVKISSATLAIELSPRRARRASATLVLHSEQDGEEPIRLPLQTARSSVKLHAGRWDYLVTANGFAEHTGELDLAGAQKLKLRLKREFSPEELRHRRTRIGLGVGLGLAGAAAAGGGAYLLTSGESRFKAFSVNEIGEKYPKRPTAQVSDLSAAGAGLLGATLGMWTGSVTGALRPSSRPVWITELVMGSALLAGGLTWYAVTMDRWQSGAIRLNGFLDTHGTEKFHAPLLISAAMAGLGAGLVPGAASGLILIRRSTRKNRGSYALRPTGSPRSLGLQIAGSF